MKKHIIIFCTALSIVLASCNKPVLAPNGSASSIPEIESKIAESNPTESKKEFSEKIRIYDKSEKYYVDLVVSSPNEATMKEGVTTMQNTKIELLEALPSPPQTAKTVNNIKPESEPISQKNALNIKIVYVEKGSFQGYRILFNFSNMQTENTAAKTSTVINGVGPLTVDLDFCSSYQVQNYGAISHFEAWYSNSGPFWTFQDDTFLNTWETYLFAPGFSAYRKLEVRKSAPGGGNGVYFYINILS